MVLHWFSPDADAAVAAAVGGSVDAAFVCCSL